MGGGGGRYSSTFSGNMQEKMKESIRKTHGEAFKTSVSDEIKEILSEYNNRESEIIQDHLNEIKEIIAEEIEGTIDLKFGGSVSKSTYVNGLSDIDTLVIIDKTELSTSSPTEVLEYIKSRLEGNLSEVNSITAGNLAVTIDFLDGNNIQILPAIKQGQGFKIPSVGGEKWSNLIRPDKFTSRLTEVNQSLNNNVVPVIKLAKGIISQFPEDQQLKGYHIESMAIKAFQRYPNEKNQTKQEMLKHFFEKAKEYVKTPIKDRSNQSIHVDDYLDTSSKRSTASNNLNNVFELMERADSSCSTSDWSKILRR